MACVAELKKSFFGEIDKVEKAEIRRSCARESWAAGRGAHRRQPSGVRKAVKWNSPLYGVQGQGWFLGVHCFTKYVKVAFFRGASLRPVPPSESKQKDVRYLDIHEGDWESAGQLDEKLVASWIRQASELPGWVP